MIRSCCFCRSASVEYAWSGFGASNAAVMLNPEIEQAHLIAGNFNYLMKIRTRSMADDRRVLAENISSLPHVANTPTYVELQAVKEDVLGDLA